ncbi:MAG: zinc metallopeptidase [Bradymonadaceae bacterium]
MFFDPLYWVVIGIGFVVSLAANRWVESRVQKWSQYSLDSGMTGREVAQSILDARGVTDVGIERASGMFSDHYDPSDRTLRLSDEVYDERTVTAAGIAAHEVGHAIQHQEGYAPMTIRQKSVPVAKIGTNLGVWMIIGGLIIGLTGLAKVGVALFGGFVAFTLITLPVEFDASSRAKQVLDEQNLVTREELDGVSEVLNAAASTYLAAALTAILQLLYWLSIVYGRE